MEPPNTTRYIAALDQGTTSTRFIVFDTIGTIIAVHQLEHPQIKPHPGWCEHDPMTILNNSVACIDEGLKQCEEKGISPSQIAGMGITNQRETTIVWDPQTGEPLHNAIVWLDTRTHSLSRQLAQELGGKMALAPQNGLPIASYFSALKLRWLMENVPRVKEAVEAGRCLFGTIDTWLLWNLTGGPQGGVHVTDVTNASRTMLFDLHAMSWSKSLCEALRIPMALLPEVRSSSEVYGHLTRGRYASHRIPIAGCLGDQQAALVGQRAFGTGDAKNTYGTGCFLLMNMGTRCPPVSTHGLLTTVAYQLGPDAAPVYAIEGSIAIAGVSIKWLINSMKMITSPWESETLARTVPNTGGVYFVPAFAGLFAPRWCEDARGLIIGMTQSTCNAHIVRAVLEATCFQTREVLEAMSQDAGGVELKELKVDGGMSQNNLLLEMQADLLGVPVSRPPMVETTALGSALAAGLAVGVWPDAETMAREMSSGLRIFPVKSTAEHRARRYRQWNRAVERSIGWLEESPQDGGDTQETEGGEAESLWD